MRFLFDMVHHNPGEAPFATVFADPARLASYGYNGQVFKHLNCVATFAATGVDVFPAGSPDHAWLEERTRLIEQEMIAAQAAGLKIYYHIDLFVLPRRLVEHYRTEICDPVTGRILLHRPKTLALHQVMFEELAARFPSVDGYVVRVGETYLFDTPYHTGNGAVPPFGPAWAADYLYADVLRGAELRPAWSTEQATAYVALLQFLREHVCVRLDRHVFFRTWDIFPDKLHAQPVHYLQVTDQIEPHPKLVFSIKHTALDFWRHVKVNECLGRGRHGQVIEVQCQREYEGKGAFPNYFMDGVIDGFEENARRIGLRQLVAHPLIRGIFSWSRGGGWFGPTIGHELWPELNLYVLSRFTADPGQDEKKLFYDYAEQKLSLRGEEADKFRELCRLSSRAILKGRYCAPFDSALRGELLPTANWMRDDRLGGRTQLRPVLNYLAAQGKFADALAEKEEAVELWRRIETLAGNIRWPDQRTGEFVMVSSAYGRILFSIILEGWRVMIAGFRGETGGQWDAPAIEAAAEHYRRLWDDYRELASRPQCPSLYLGYYLFRPGEPQINGLDETVDYYRKLAARFTTAPGLSGSAHSDSGPLLT